jgi:hypothetical protein
LVDSAAFQLTKRRVRITRQGVAMAGTQIGDEISCHALNLGFRVNTRKEIGRDVETRAKTYPCTYASAVSAARTGMKGSVEAELQSPCKDAVKFAEAGH